MTEACALLHKISFISSSVSAFSRLLGSACTELYRKPLQISSQALLFLAELGCYQGRRVRLQTPQTIIMIARDAFSGSSVSPFTAWGSSRSVTCIGRVGVTSGCIVLVCWFSTLISSLDSAFGCSRHLTPLTFLNGRNNVFMY